MVRPFHSMVALKFLAIVLLLRVISPCHKMNMMYPKHRDPICYGYIPIRKLKP
jgi:hypothetical protein